MSKMQKTLKRLAGQKVLFLMILPCMIYTFIFSYYPLSGWIMAFQNYKPAKGIPVPRLWGWISSSSFFRILNSGEV